MKTKIYGGSDDLIEIEGAINDEVGCFDHKKPIKIFCSDGTYATIFYSGEWSIKILNEGNKFLQVINSVGDDREHTLNDAKGLTSYSDVLILDEGIEWIKIGRKTFKQ